MTEPGRPKRFSWSVVVVAGVAVAGAGMAGAQEKPPDTRPPPLFAPIHRVLTSPRCMNCHPTGDVPLQGDDSRPHAMGVRRSLLEVGQACATCHRASPYRAPGMPPGAPNWHLPPKDTPMIFEGRDVDALCVQLRDPAQNGGKTLQELVHHVDKDPLVRWGFDPGEGRTKVPMPHADFVDAMRAWASAGGPCPGDDARAPQAPSPRKGGPPVDDRGAPGQGAAPKGPRQDAPPDEGAGPAQKK